MVDKDFAYSFLNRDASVVDSMLLQKLEHSFRLSVIAASGRSNVRVKETNTFQLCGHRSFVWFVGMDFTLRQPIGT